VKLLGRGASEKTPRKTHIPWGCLQYRKIGRREGGYMSIVSWVTTVGKARRHAQCMEDMHSFYNSDLVWANKTLSLAQSEFHEMTTTPCSIHE
jgi:hypothetical protein